MFEGEKTEKRIFDNIKRNFFTDSSNTILHASFCSDIYQLWKELADDEYLDLLELLRERSDKNRENLKDISRDDISETYLFFDYDGHATNANDDKIAEMVEYFYEGTETGKLFISYPMAEALKDISDSEEFVTLEVPAKENIGYKNLIVSRSKFLDLRKIGKPEWGEIITLNIEKAHFIIHDQHTIPSSIDDCSQSLIFENQLRKFIEPREAIAVLSGFPFFIVEYFGFGIIDFISSTIITPKSIAKEVEFLSRDDSHIR